MSATAATDGDEEFRDGAEGSIPFARSKFFNIKNLGERNLSKEDCFITELITNRTTAFLLTSYLLLLALNLLALSFIVRAPNLRQEAGSE